ncbi:MAG: ion transporter [Desulfovibrio sp.]|nr:ion transporter [Desulfovibrio sp.]
MQFKSLNIKRNVIKILRTIRRERKLNTKFIDRFILTVIFINAVSLGLEISEYFRENYIDELQFVDRFALAIFTVEVGAKMLIQRLRFFINPWRVFDFIVVAPSFAPIVASSLDPSPRGLPALRSLRILRIFLFISFLPQLRVIVHSLLLALPCILGISLLLIIKFYVFGVIATQSFHEISYENFGNLGNRFIASSG